MSNPELIGDILKKFQRKHFQGGFPCSKLSHLWDQLIPPEIRIHTKVTAFRKNTLVICVDNPTSLCELSLFRKIELLKELRNQIPEIYIRDIHFQIGKLTTTRQPPKLPHTEMSTVAKYHNPQKQHK